MIWSLRFRVGVFHGVKRTLKVCSVLQGFITKAFSAGEGVELTIVFHRELKEDTETSCSCP